jgi:transposase
VRQAHAPPHPTSLQWKDAPRDYGPHKTLYNRLIRWSRLGVFDRIFAVLASSQDGRRAEISPTYSRLANFLPVTHKLFFGIGCAIMIML